jgi:hypothetical protein
MDDLMMIAIGAGLGAVACYMIHNGLHNNSAEGVGALLHGPEAQSYVAFGHDLARSGYNNSEVWDTRDRLYFSDNLLYNKTPFIQLKPTTDWDPNRLDFAGAYGPPDMDSPRPRLEHFQDLEIRAF